MQKVIIVDDEYLAVEGLRQLVDWSSYGMEVSGVAYDGLSGLELIKLQQPGIVLVDIRMPGMNGLDLIKAAKTAVPNVIFVIVSGYNDFEYVRMALRLGVADYVEKPVTIEKIQGIMANISGIIKARSEFDSMQDPYDGKRSELLREALGNLIALPAISEHDLISLQNKYGINLQGMRNLAICAVRFAAVEALDELKKLLDEQMPEQKAGFSEYCIDKQYLIIFHSQENRYESSEFKHVMYGICRSLIERGYYCRMGMGSCYSGLCDIGQALRDARKAIEYAEFFDEDFLSIGDVEYNLTLPACLLDDENSIVFNLRSGRYEDVLRQVKGAVNLLIDSNLSLDLFCHECLELVYLGLRVCRESGAEYSRGQERFLPHVDINRYTKAAEIGEWVVSVFKGMLGWLEEYKNTTGDKNILKAREYIDSHYQEEITLGLLSDICGMYPTYLSVVFKQKFGQTYVKYLNQVRMEHAKALLQSNPKIKDIYEKVGFTSYRYFCDKFKSYYGYTPGRYRNQL